MSTIYLFVPVTILVLGLYSWWFLRRYNVFLAHLGILWILAMGAGVLSAIEAFPRDVRNVLGTGGSYLGVMALGGVITLALQVARRPNAPESAARAPR